MAWSVLIIITFVDECVWHFPAFERNVSNRTCVSRERVCKTGDGNKQRLDQPRLEFV